MTTSSCGRYCLVGHELSQTNYALLLCTGRFAAIIGKGALFLHETLHERYSLVSHLLTPFTSLLP